MIRTLAGAAIAAALVFAVACGGGGGETPGVPPAADEWPKLGQDLASTFHNEGESRLSVENVAQLERAWVLETEGSVTGTPALVGGRVYALAGGALYAIDAATGAVIWVNSDIGGTSSPTYDGGRLYVLDGGAVVHALDAGTGEEIWQALIDEHPQASGFSSPLVFNGLVTVGVSSTEVVTARDEAVFRGSVAAFDKDTGEELWRRYTADPPANGASVWSSQSVDLETGAVFGSSGQNYVGEAGAGSDSIFAVDSETGALIWNHQATEGDLFTIPSPEGTDFDFGTNPVLFQVDARKMVGGGQKAGVFWALDRETGEVVWSRQVSEGSALIGGVFNNGAFDGERIIVAGNNGTSEGPGSEPANGESGFGAITPTSVLMAMDPAEGAVLWERQLPAWVWAPIAIANGVGYVAVESALQAFDVTTGEKLFEFDTDGTIASGPAVAGGRVVFGSGLGYFSTDLDNKLIALALPE